VKTFILISYYKFTILLMTTIIILLNNLPFYFQSISWLFKPIDKDTIYVLNHKNQFEKYKQLN
jgi:hypothetical protein